MKLFSRLTIVLLLLIFANCSDDKSRDNNPARIPSAVTLGVPLFTCLPLDATNFIGFVPLGNLNPPGHTLPTDHHYFYLTDYTKQVSVYAPGRIWITSIKSSTHSNAGFTDYDVTFYACQEVYGKLGHVSSLSSNLQYHFSHGTISWSDTYSTGGETYTAVRKSVFIEVQASNIIGTAGGNPGQFALDFGVYDFRTNHVMVNPSRYYDDYLRAVPCTGYYESGLMAYLESRSGNYSGTEFRTVNPIGGSVARDIAGTAQGNWFRSGFPSYPEDPHLSLGHNHIDPSIPVFSTGTSVSGLSSGTYSYSLSNTGITNRDFSAITADGNIYCFQGVHGSAVILLQLVNNNLLRMEKQDLTNGPPWNFMGNQVDFIR